MHPNSCLNHLELDAPLSLGSDDGVLYFYIPSDEITAFLHLTNHITTTTSWRIESNREFKAISPSKRDTSRLVDTWNTQISGHLLQPNKSRRDHYCSFVCYCYFLSHFVYTQTLRAKPDSHWRRSADWLYGDSRARLNVVKFLGTRPNQHTATICNPKHTNTINPVPDLLIKWGALSTPRNRSREHTRSSQLKSTRDAKWRDKPTNLEWFTRPSRKQSGDPEHVNSRSSIDPKLYSRFPFRWTIARARAGLSRVQVWLTKHKSFTKFRRLRSSSFDAAIGREGTKATELTELSDSEWAAEWARSNLLLLLYESRVQGSLGRRAALNAGRWYRATRWSWFGCRKELGTKALC